MVSIIAILVSVTVVPAQDREHQQALELIEAYQTVTRRVAGEVLPVVVELEVVERVSRRVLERPSPLEFFFGRPESDSPDEPQMREFEQRGIGSGIIVRREGDTVYVLTNAHVAGAADQIRLRLYDGREFEAELVGADENRDLALVRFETDEQVPLARLGNSDDVQVGDFVLAIGNPLGFESTVTSGIVSAIERQAPPRPGMPVLTQYIQTDAAINRGNSGGALVNLRGEVVGINAWIASQTGGSIGLGFAIPINNAQRAIDQFIENGQVEYGWLGVSMADPPASPSNSLMESAGGALVFGVYDDSPAAVAGIQPGDVIVQVGETSIGDANDLLQAVANLSPGERTRFRVRRGGAGMPRTYWVETGRRPDGRDGIDQRGLWPGLSVVEISDQIRDNLEMAGRDGDLIVSQVVPGSPAATAGLRSGDIITRLNDSDVSTLREFYLELNAPAGDELVFRIRRSDTNLIIGLVR